MNASVRRTSWRSGVLALAATAAVVVLAARLATTMHATTAPPQAPVQPRAGAAAVARGGGSVPAGPLTIGINANTQGYGVHAGRLQNRVARTGVRWLREELDWDVVEPTRGRDNWRHDDELYTAAAQRGMTILPVILSTPRWAGPSPQALPANPAAYARFVARVVRRYGPGGVFWTHHPRLTPVPSTWFELWNEPYTTAFSGGRPDAATYARLVAAAGAAAHAANHAAKVLLASDIVTTTVDGRVTSWTDAMYDAVPTLNQDFDGVAVHPYALSLTATTNDVYGRFVAVLVDVRNAFIAHGAADKPFWLTEIGWSTCPGGASAGCVTDVQQAALYTQLFVLLHTTYASYVRAVFAYHYNDFPGAPRNDTEGYFGLTRVGGSHKPAYAAFAAAIAADPR
jgi:hypothetical protein